MFDEINNKNFKVQREANTLKSKEFAIKRRNFKKRKEKRKYTKKYRDTRKIKSITISNL
jgi:hypothetical protein